MSMTEYTRWWIAHPWHVTGTPESGKVPPDCGCQRCARNVDRTREEANNGKTNIQRGANLVEGEEEARRQRRPDARAGQTT